MNGSLNRSPFTKFTLAISFFSAKAEPRRRDSKVGSKATILLFVPLARAMLNCEVPLPTSIIFLPNPQNFLKFKEVVYNSAFKFNDLKSVSFYPSKRWDITTVENILINLPQDNLLQSLNLAYKLMIDDSFKEIKIIDLRVKNHLVIK